MPQIDVDQDGLLAKKYFTYPSVPKSDGEWYSGNTYSWVNNKVKDLATYADYTTRHMIENNKTYEMEYDWYGPIYWGPAHCIGRFDFNRPKCSAP